MGSQGSAAVRFGVFELDLQTRELRKRGVKIKLQHQPFAILEMLVERPGEVVSREQIRERLWPGTHVDYENGLNAALARLRQAIGDSADNPRFVETLPRVGYRFIGAMEGAATRAVTPLARPGSRISSRRRKYRLAMAAAILFACVALGVWRSRANAPSSAAPQFKLTQLTRDSGLTFQPALSPDGKLVAFASDRGGKDNLDIWVQQAGSSEPLQITDNEADDYQPSFSPDGSRIVFCSDRGGGGIYIVSALGGQVTRVAEGGAFPHFSPDGKWIAFSRGSFLRSSNLYIVAAGGGSARCLDVGVAWASAPVWSPDGNSLLFVGSLRESNATLSESELDWWVAPAGGGKAARTGATDVFRKARVLASTFFGNSLWSGGASFWPDGKHILFAARMGDSSSLWRAAISPATWKITREPQLLTTGTQEGQPSIALDGRIAFSIATFTADIWALPIDSTRAVVTGDLEKVVGGMSSETSPSVSADGKQMVFVSERSGNSDVWMKDLESGKESPLTVTPEDE